MGIEPRGRDATGAAWRDKQGRVVIQKDAKDATDFIRNLSLPRRTQTAVLHTRMWTQGSPSDRNNNHPIVTGPIVGVHNGCVNNDYELFNQMGKSFQRQGEVDSEAIFATIAYGLGTNSKGEKLFKQANTTPDLLAMVEGTASVGWLNREDPADTLHVARLYGSPLVWGQTALGSFVFASTKWALEDACKEARLDLVHIEEMKEGTYHRIRHGIVAEVADFEPAGMGFSYGHWTGHGYTMRSGGTYVKNPNGPGWVRESGWSNKAKDDEAEYEAWKLRNSLLNGRDIDGVDEEPDEETLRHRSIDTLTDESGIEWLETAEGGWVPVREAKEASETVRLPRDWDWDDEDCIEFHASSERIGGDFCNANFLNLDRNVARLSKESVDLVYKDRMEQVKNWAKGLKVKNGKELTEAFVDCHADLRPGDWVTTEFWDEKVYAQVYHLAQTFPDGHYILIVTIPKEDREGSYEKVFITRMAHEFVSADTSITADAPELEETNEEEVVNAGS